LAPVVVMPPNDSENAAMLRARLSLQDRRVGFVADGTCSPVSPPKDSPRQALGTTLDVSSKRALDATYSTRCGGDDSRASPEMTLREAQVDPAGDGAWALPLPEFKGLQRQSDQNEEADPRSPPASTIYEVGDGVELWSRTAQAWCPGRVTEVTEGWVDSQIRPPDGEIAQKALPVGHPYLRHDLFHSAMKTMML